MELKLNLDFVKGFPSAETLMCAKVAIEISSTVESSYITLNEVKGNAKTS